MSQGIVFEKLKNTIINDNEWRLVLDFNIQGLNEESDELETLYSKLSEQLLNFTVTINEGHYWFKDVHLELERVRVTLDSYQDDLEGLLELLPRERFKRGLINLGGYAAKFLFGVATTDDLEETNHKVNVLQDIAGDVIHSKQDQLTLLKDVNAKVGLNTKSVIEVMEKLTNFSNTYRSLNDKTLQHWTEMYDHLLHFLYLGNEVRQLGQVMDEAKLRIVEFRQALELVKTNRLSSKLLPPNEFLPILLKIEKLLPVDLRLPVSVDVENAFLYYDLCKIQAVSTLQSIRLFINLPLTSSASQFETYKIHIIPVFNPLLKHWLAWKLTAQYLLLSSDRQYYLPITAFDFSKCQENLYFWCPNIVSIRKNTVADCHYSLFMGSESGKLCNKVIKSNVLSPYWIKNGNDWIFSVDKTEKITLKCWNYDVVTNKETCEVRDVDISEVGILKNSSRCEIYGSNFKIFHKIQGNTKFMKNLTDLHIPEFSGMLLPVDNETLTYDLNITFDTISLLRNELGNDSVEISLNKILTKLRNTDSTIKVNYDYRIEFFVIVVLCIGTILLLVMVLCYRKKHKETLRHGHRSTILTDIRRQVPDRGIQISDALREIMEDNL